MLSSHAFSFVVMFFMFPMLRNCDGVIRSRFVVRKSKERPYDKGDYASDRIKHLLAMEKQATKGKSEEGASTL